VSAEFRIQQLILRQIKDRFPRVYVARTGVDFGSTVALPPGYPDITLIVKGRFVGVEVKSRRGRQGAEQKKQQALIEAAGGLYVIARSLDDVLEVLA
jgi:hypothetical protein